MPRRDPNTFAHAHVPRLSTREPIETGADADADENETTRAGRFWCWSRTRAGRTRSTPCGGVRRTWRRRCVLKTQVPSAAADRDPYPCWTRSRGAGRRGWRTAPLAAGGGGANRRVTHFLYVRPPLGQYVACRVGATSGRARRAEEDPARVPPRRGRRLGERRRERGERR